MTQPNDSCLMTAAELSAAIRARHLSCREVMSAHLDRIEQLNPAVNAIIALRDRDVLLAEAEERDAQLGRGEVMGWMHGLPHAVKDLADVRGLPTSKGSPLLAGHMPVQDSLIVERMRRAGAIFIGKTNVPEFGLGSHSYNPVHGVTRNPWNTGRSAGGSSGGAAVALALRMAPVADGSDFGGSLRNPAAWNNVFGLRPSAGRVPAWPATESFVSQLSTEGPMARDVTDLALLLSTLAGRDARAPLSLEDAPEAFARPLAHDARGTRIGWLGDYAASLPLEAGVLDVCRQGLAALEAVGCRVEEARMPLSREQIWDTWLGTRHWLAMNGLMPFYQDPEKRRQLKPEALWEVEGGLRMSALDTLRASAGRSALYQAFLVLFTRFDALVLPSAQCFAFPAEWHWPQEIGGTAMDTYHRWMEVVFPASLSGCPTISVPAGFGGALDLPMGLQIIAPPRQDLALLRLAHAYEQAITPVLARLPPALRA
ncbi:amidase [Roseomonas marmotae]|uniref:Amidase n=1 Tax=Roseomonas marmotae TaxID=2768161 RepID=A0ABS3KFW1_9PROT|nr:amidase [Roseomonas marmotae]MBO1076364.1 amidase [Roseomonas marmotae]QTI79426.1 amidase [Roseomonas marmotae]